MANTYTLIQSATSTSTSVTFSSIPATYTDLKIVASARSDAGTVYDIAFMRFNSDAGNNYSGKILYGTGAVTGSANAGTSAIDFRYYNGANATTSSFGSTEAYIPNYASTTAYKSVSIDGVSENNATAAFAAINAGLWSSNSAINSITILNAGGANFVTGSTFYLYGIKNS
jgi:hypothetical protein